MLEANTRVTVHIESSDGTTLLTGTLIEPFTNDCESLILRKQSKTCIVPAHRIVYIETERTTIHHEH